MKPGTATLALLLLTGCGVDGMLGDPFYTNFGLVDPEAGAEAGDDSASPVAEAGLPGQDAQAAPEGGHADSGHPGQDAGRDASGEAGGEAGLDSGTIAETGVDTGTAEVDSGVTDSGPSCPNALAPILYWLNSAKFGPSNDSAPAACATCGLYTCSCILANDPRLNRDAGGFMDCTCSIDSQGVAEVACAQ